MKGDDYLPLTRAGTTPGREDRGPLVLAAAFAIHDTVAPTGELRALAEREDLAVLLPRVPELVHPARGTLHVLRELEALEIPLAVVGTGPVPLVEKIARAFWFRGETIAAGPEGTAAALLARMQLPAACLWFVTADIREAATARDAGMNAVLLEPGAEGSFAQPDGRGLYVAPRIDDVLEIIRIPYTRSVINLRHLFHALVQTRSSESPS